MKLPGQSREDGLQLPSPSRAGTQSGVALFRDDLVLQRGLVQDLGRSLSYSGWLGVVEEELPEIALS